MSLQAKEIMHSYFGTFYRVELMLKLGAMYVRDPGFSAAGVVVVSTIKAPEGARGSVRSGRAPDRGGR
jgi:hypothetical protein